MTEYRAIIKHKDADPMGYDPLFVDSDNFILWRESVYQILASDRNLIAVRFRKINKHYEPYDGPVPDLGGQHE